MKSLSAFLVNLLTFLPYRYFMQFSNVIKKPGLIMIIIVMAFASCVDDAEFRIIPLCLDDTQTQIINGKQLTWRTDYFLVDNGLINNHGIQEFIANYVHRADSLKTKYSYYEMKFYKRSWRLNTEELENLPQNLKWKFFRDKTPVAHYDFQFGKLMPN